MIYAGGAALPATAPWFEGKITPVRGQMICLDGPAPPPFRAQAGYLYGGGASAGAAGALFGGARWATPHLEVGETDDDAVSAAVEEKLAAFARRHFPALAGAPIRRRWSGIMAMTCDGLPFVGPLPGGSRALACAGFGGRGLSLAVASGRAVAEGLLTGRAPGLPGCFRAGRMVG